MAGGIAVLQADALLVTALVAGVFSIVVIAICVWQWFAVKTWRDALFMVILGTFVAGGAEHAVLSPVGGQVEALLSQPIKEAVGNGLATLYGLVIFVPIARILLVSAETRPSKWQQWAFYGGALACIAVVAVLRSGALY